MKKFLVSISVIMISSSAVASCDIESYYDSIGTQKGYDLKSALANIIRKSHKSKRYDDLYSAYRMGDSDTTYDNDGTVMDIYSEDPDGKDPYNYRQGQKRCGNYRIESNCYNREHIFPQSLFFKQTPMRSDYFHVVPTDGKVNGMRGSYPFGEVGESIKWTSKNGSKVGHSVTPGYRGMVFEPLDEFKGDVARALFYFVTRYENQMPRFKPHEMTNGSREQALSSWFLKLLIKWHKLDPVSDHERQRNEAGCKFQKNRNPYIDNPEWISKIYE